MNKLRIVHIYKDYFPVLGGIENHIKQLAEAQTAVGHQVIVLVTNPNKQPHREQLNGVNLVRASRLATVASTPLSAELPVLLARTVADIYHFHAPYPLGEISQLAVGRGRPYLVAYHSDVIKQQGILRFYRPFLQRFLAGAAAIIASNEKYIDSSVYLRPLAEKCHIIPYSVDAGRFQGARPLLEPAGWPTILFMGQHRYYKGVDVLIKAMTQVEARLLIGGDGPMRSEWEALVKEYHLEDKVQFLGRIPDEDLPGFYASGDIFVLPSNSRAESFGLVLQEAMAAGLPCVTTELGTGTSYLVQDEVSGFVVPPKDSEALAAVLKVLIANPALRQEFGQAGQQRAATEFTLNVMVAKIETLYRKILESFEDQRGDGR